MAARFLYLLRDLRFALRQLGKSPVFTLTIVLTLALGIGANTAVFSVFDQVLLRALPVPHPEQLVRFEWTGPFNGSASAFGGEISSYYSYPMYKDLSADNKVLSGLLATDESNVAVSSNGKAENEDAEIVSGNYFQVLGLRPAAGRLLTSQDMTGKNADPVLVLSYGYWKSRFNASQDAIGQTILINHHPFTILGVAPQNFHSAIGGFVPRVFLPLTMSEVAMPWTAQRDNFHNRRSIWLTIVGRLKPGVSRDQAQVSFSTLWHSLHAQELTLYTTRTSSFTKRFLASRITIEDASAGFSPGRAQLKTPLTILMSMASLLVAMCVINVATLLLLRASGRTREMSMRYALGARRSRIVSQLLVEGAMFGLLGAAVGLVTAPMLTSALVHLLTHADPGSEPYSGAIDTHVLLFTLAVSIFASLLFSVAPVLQFFRPDLMESLRQSTGTASRGSQRFRKAAVGLQIGLSVLLLGSAGLFMRTLDNLRTQSVGFDTGHLDTFSVDPSTSGYDGQQIAAVVTRVLDAVRQIPAVTQVAATTDPELSDNNWSNDFTLQGYHPGPGENMNMENPWITPGYFAALRQPVLAGRGFTPADGPGQPKVAIVNLVAAKRYYGSAGNALGRMIAGGSGVVGETGAPDTQIVGVVGNIKHTDLRTEMGPAVYQPYLQEEHPAGVVVYARTALAPEAMDAAIRKAVHAVDPTLVVDALRTMEAQVNISTEDEQALAILAIGFSILAMALAAVGLYGVLSYATEQRTREIGVRLALGAQRSSIVYVILREMLMIALIATVVALPAVLAVGQLFRSQLYGIHGYDVGNLFVSVALTAAMVALAAALPARRAAGVEPVQALRTE
jgi:putative ABC transport system permease protein